jgi:hypothetical protein
MSSQRSREITTIKAARQRRVLKICQVVFTPVHFTDRRPHIIDAARSDSIGHRAADLDVRLLDERRDFKHKDRLPIKALHLGSTEELLAIRAKKRPCLIIGASDGVDWKSLPVGVQQNKAMNSFDRVYLLAPLYSVSTVQEPSSFGPVMTVRIKHMMYPEFVYAPRSGGIVNQDSVIRLDRVFWTQLTAVSDPQDLFVSRDVMGICWNQIAILGGNAPADADFSELRELMLQDLPTEYK